MSDNDLDKMERKGWVKLSPTELEALRREAETSNEQLLSFAPWPEAIVCPRCEARLSPEALHEHRCVSDRKALVVWAVIGERENIPYEDPGAEEVVSLHASEEGAYTAVRAHEKGWRGYEHYSVKPMDVES